MTPEQARASEAIRQTQALCATAGDRGRVEQMLDAYTDDGELELHTGVFRGKAAIGGALGQVVDDASGAGAPPGARYFLRHHLTTSHIEFAAGDTANVRTYFLVMTPAGLDHCGVYTDRFVARGERWLIAYRRVRIDWMSPASHFSDLQRSDQPGTTQTRHSASNASSSHQG